MTCKHGKPEFSYCKECCRDINAEGSKPAESTGSIAGSSSGELKPCPFCGAEADHFDPPNEEEDGYVCCSNGECDATGYDMAVDKWNKRV